MSEKVVEIEPDLQGGFQEGNTELFIYSQIFSNSKYHITFQHIGIVRNASFYFFFKKGLCHQNTPFIPIYP